MEEKNSIDELIDLLNRKLTNYEVSTEIVDFDEIIQKWESR